jgi:hypothetical protein
LPPRPALEGAALARVIDQKAAHHPRPDGDEVGPALPARAGLVDQLEVGLVHERGGLEGVSGALAAHIGAGQPS